MSRGLWFLAGAGAGVYALTKARRAAETFTPEGLHDRLSALNLGAQLWVEEFRSARDEREGELREQLGLSAHGPLALTPGQAPPPGSCGALPPGSDPSPTHDDPRPKELT